MIMYNHIYIYIHIYYKYTDIQMNGEHPAEPWRLPHFCTVSRSCEMTLESSCARIMSLEP